MYDMYGNIIGEMANFVPDQPQHFSGSSSTSGGAALESLPWNAWMIGQAAPAGSGYASYADYVANSAVQVVPDYGGQIFVDTTPAPAPAPIQPSGADWGGTVTTPISAPAPSPAPAPAPAPVIKPTVPVIQQTVNNMTSLQTEIYRYAHTLPFGSTPDNEKIAATKLAAMAKLKGWTCEDMGLALGFSTGAMVQYFVDQNISGVKVNNSSSTTTASNPSASGGATPSNGMSSGSIMAIGAAIAAYFMIG